jgi:phosphatidylserine/phosphatidylglycerophosphate/cardiolipin synthase-like enzyme
MVERRRMAPPVGQPTRRDLAGVWRPIVERRITAAASISWGFTWLDELVSYPVNLVKPRTAAASSGVWRDRITRAMAWRDVLSPASSHRLFFSRMTACGSPPDTSGCLELQEAHGAREGSALPSNAPRLASIARPPPRGRQCARAFEKCNPRPITRCWYEMCRGPSRMTRRYCVRRRLLTLGAVALACVVALPAAAQDQVYFTATTDVAARLIERINAENVRIDMAVSALTHQGIADALTQRFEAGVGVRLIADQYSIFEADTSRRETIYRLASRGIPIRVRYNPTWYPELVHWKATIFAGQNIVSFGTSNYTPVELAPQSSGAYSDGSVIFTSDAALVNAFRTQFDRMWNDTQREAGSLAGPPPYFKNWDEACASEPLCADYRARYPSPVPMAIDTARLEPDHPMPPDMIWAQGSTFNNRIVAEIQNEGSRVDLVVYRLTSAAITDALIARHHAGVPVRVIIEPNEYRNRMYPEFWITSANVDRLKAAGVPIKQRAHDGVTQMRMLVTSSYATVASSNFTEAWQRDHNYLVSSSTKPALYAALRDRFDLMWNNTAAFVAFTPQPPDAPSPSAPANGATGQPTEIQLSWRRTPFATAYDIYLGTSPGSLTRVGTVSAFLVNQPPEFYTFRLSGLQPHTTYYWRAVALTNAGLSQASPTWAFTTGATSRIIVSPSSIDVGPRGGSASIGITSDIGWTATSSASWVRISPPSGFGSGVVTVTIERNRSTATRTATVLFNDVPVSVVQSPNVLPDAPTGLQVLPQGAIVYFGWQPASTGGEPLRFQIEVSASPDFASPRVVATPGTETVYQVTGLAGGHYYARVSAVNELGVGPPSAPVTFYKEPSAPGPPQNVRYVVTGSSVTLMWDPQGDPAIGHLIEAGFAPGRTDISLPNYSPATSITYHGVPAGVYYVRIRAGNHLGISEPSVEIPVYVNVPPPPAPPTNLTAAVVGSHVTLSWSPGPPSDRTGPPSYYIVEAGYASGSRNIGTANVGPNTVVGVPGVPPGTYYVRVRAGNATGVSGTSSEIKVVVP